VFFLKKTVETKEEKPKTIKVPRVIMVEISPFRDFFFILKKL